MMFRTVDLPVPAKSGLIRRLIDVSPTGNKLNPNDYKEESGIVTANPRTIFKIEPFLVVPKIVFQFLLKDSLGEWKRHLCFVTDGDTVMVIPTGGKVKITSTRALEGLEGFDPKLEYGGKPEGSFKPMVSASETRVNASLVSAILVLA